ncbi:hypothetical protein ACRS8P_01155 [Burkholderia cenocepacia]
MTITPEQRLGQLRDPPHGVETIVRSSGSRCSDVGRYSTGLPRRATSDTSITACAEIDFGALKSGIDKVRKQFAAQHGYWNDE